MITRSDARERVLPMYTQEALGGASKRGKTEKRRVRVREGASSDRAGDGMSSAKWALLVYL